MSNELSTEISPEIINSLILTGDMSKLTAGQQTQYYTAVCNTLGLNPLTQPFAIIVLQGKKTLYALKGCTQQLCGINKINTEIKERKTEESVYIVSVRATMPDGRFTDEDGVVSIVGLKGVELANAMMKATTKSKRRAVLALCGLGMSDESEVEDMRLQPDVKSDQTKSRIENIIDAQVEKTTEVAVGHDIIPPEKRKESQEKMKQEAVQTMTEWEKEDLGKPQQVIGVIKEIPVCKTTKNGLKYTFKIENKEYGTTDKNLASSILDVLDIQSKSEFDILIQFEYVENVRNGKKFNDITAFKQMTAKDIPI